VIGLNFHAELSLLSHYVTAGACGYQYTFIIDKFRACHRDPFPRSEDMACSQKNSGVLKYQIVGCSAGVMMHRVVYKCPVSGNVYRFITSLNKTIPPGLIAFLYKCRWDIEKIFDEIKIKLAEKKAWATSYVAKKMQAQFVCMAHNLMLILEGYIEKLGIRNVIEDIRRSNRLKQVPADKRSGKKTLTDFLKKPKRATHRSVKFIRCLRNHLFMSTSWKEALEPLQRIYAAF